jgi:hypothetical protein
MVVQPPVVLLQRLGSLAHSRPAQHGIGHHKRGSSCGPAGQAIEGPTFSGFGLLPNA